MYLYWVLLVCFVSLVQSKDECTLQRYCEECIQKSGCAWIQEENEKRCFRNTCDKVNAYVYNPGNSIQFLENKPLSKTVHVSPQKVQASLRVGQSTYFTAFVKSFDESVDGPRMDQYIFFGSNKIKPNEVQLSIGLRECPKEPSQFHQVFYLRTTSTLQNLTLDLYLNCACPF